MIPVNSAYRKFQHSFRYVIFFMPVRLAMQSISVRHHSSSPHKRALMSTITVTASATKTYQETTKKVTVTVNPAKVKLTGVKNYKGKKLKAYWKKNTKVTGYQVQYSTSSKFKSAKTVTVKGCKNTSKNIYQLAKKKKYYVRVRTYKTVSKVNYYSGWSNVKSITIKK